MKNRDEAGLTEIQWQKIRRYARAYEGATGFRASGVDDKVWLAKVEIYPNHVPDPKWDKPLSEKI